MTTSSTTAHCTPVAAPAIVIDRGLIAKFNQSGPRYTSYPTADRFSGSFGFGSYLETVAGLQARRGRAPLSLYIHVPFCASICYYCACNKVITKDRSKADVYLSYLKKEVSMQGRLFAGMNRVEQLHFGGGTPTYLSDAQMDELMAHLRHWFEFAPDMEGEYSIEVDPRTVDEARIYKLRAQGFNRISMGVQDFNHDVQVAVNRVQSEEDTRALIAASRAAGFRSVSIDLIYGLPRQTLFTMEQTLAKVIDCAPDRISIYSYAHMPHLFKPQRRIDEDEMPDSATKLDMLALCIKRLTDAGYVYIGMDHFAKPGDELAVAQRQGRLHRNFQGYSTRSETDLVACGVSAISAVGATYSQNEKTLDAYYEKLDEDKLPIARGLRLDSDDLLRRLIIQRLMCNFELSIKAIEQAWPVKFNSYFAAEIQALRAFEQDGLVEAGDEWLTVTPKGRLLVRNICMVFDHYLGSKAVEGPQPLRYSKTI
jgi:oxygen-independent coproporphyrinogen-3 oxidase